MKSILFAFFWIILLLPTFAQQTPKQIHSREQLWTAYFNQTRISEKIGFWTDLQYRRTDNFADRPFQLLVRPAITYFYSNSIRVNAGYLYAHHYPAKGLNTARPEHRIWQQVWWGQKHSGFSTIQYLRLEQRFIRLMENDQLINGYRKINRIRYNFTLFVPLKGKEIVSGTPFFVLSDEVFLNFGKNVTYNHFDQNRLFIGAGYQMTPELNIQAGYFNVYQQEASGHVFWKSHAIRVAAFHNLDLR